VDDFRYLIDEQEHIFLEIGGRLVEVVDLREPENRFHPLAVDQLREV